MSKDFIVFDPSGLGPLPPKQELLAWIHGHVGDGYSAPRDSATENIKKLLQKVAATYGTEVNGGPWNYWPPTLLANGRHCTFNLSWSVDSTNFCMGLNSECQSLGVVLIDPGGNEPFMTIPGGGGLLD